MDNTARFPPEVEVTAPLNPSMAEIGRLSISGRLLGKHGRRLFAL